VNTNPAQVQNIMDFVQKGGIMMIPIGLCSLIAVSVIIERLVSLRRRSIIPPSFLPGLRKVMDNNPGDTVAALDYCRSSNSAIANVLGAGIRKIDRRSAEAVEKSIEEAGERAVLKMRKYLRVLAVIASVTPLMGLLGTIIGMIMAFQTVAMSGEALGKTEMLAGGIYQAMITTAAGLTVAIPVLICYHWISAKIERLVADIDQMSVDFVDDFGDGSPRRRPVPAPTVERVEKKQTETVVTAGAKVATS
jgi:biopolymer transport protein ExbB